MHRRPPKLNPKPSNSKPLLTSGLLVYITVLLCVVGAHNLQVDAYSESPTSLN